LIENTIKAVLIVSGKLGKELVPRLHDIDNLMGIILFSETSEEKNEWAC